MSGRRSTRLLSRIATARDLARVLKGSAESQRTAFTAGHKKPQLPPFLDGLPEVGQSYEPQQKVTRKLKKIIEDYSYESIFEQAIDTVSRQQIPELDRIQTLDQYYFYLDALVTWIPGIRVWEWYGEKLHERTVYLRLTQFYYYFNQPGLESLQSPIDPVKGTKLTPVSEWMWHFAVEWGSFLNTGDSIKYLHTFKYAPEFNYQDYREPHGGYKTFNEFFARQFSEIKVQRPVASAGDDRVIVSPADSVYVGQWEVTTATKKGQEPKREPSIVVKHIEWPISELLADSKYAKDFEGGVLIHSFLNSYDYHRQHAPVGGTVLEAKFIRGQVYLEVSLEDEGQDKSGDLARAVIPHRYLDAADNTGYQFVQCRGLLVIDSPIGKVAVLPMGMAQVSSVVFVDPDDRVDNPGLYPKNHPDPKDPKYLEKLEDPKYREELAQLLKKKWVGRKIEKGQMFSFFQFGGSDIVTVFERKANVHMTATVGVHYKIRSQIANAGI